MYYIQRLLYYGCKHRNMNRGHKYDYRKQSREELLDDGGVLSDSEIYILYRMYDKLEKL